VIRSLQDVGERNRILLWTFYCLSGDLESAIETLEYAYETFEDSSFWLPWYIRFSYFKSLHSDPRFQELIKKMKLDPYFNNAME